MIETHENVSQAEEGRQELVPQGQTGLKRWTELLMPSRPVGARPQPGLGGWGALEMVLAPVPLLGWATPIAQIQQRIIWHFALRLQVASACLLWKNGGIHISYSFFLPGNKSSVTFGFKCKPVMSMPPYYKSQSHDTFAAKLLSWS